MDLQLFLKDHNIECSIWDSAGIEWSLLEKIHADYQSRIPLFEDVAEFIVRTIQSFNGVHSVRWRVKNPDHLVEKIIRKRAQENTSSKYLDISLENYHEIVSDLIGVRALHLFKEDCLKIDEQVQKFWALSEPPVCYIREGDKSDILDTLAQRNVMPKEHGAGYRSLHYVLKSKPSLTEVRAELQVRTIFEEGWSEVDHTIRYPNLSDDPVVANYLLMFNRLAGSADEMASFVKILATFISTNDVEMKRVSSERDDAMRVMEAEVEKLSIEREGLKVDLKKMRSAMDSLRRADREARAYGTVGDSISALSLAASTKNALTGAFSGMGITDLMQSPTQTVSERSLKSWIEENQKSSVTRLFRMPDGEK
jgi:putative GTP pyrophosphokinase